MPVTGYGDLFGLSAAMVKGSSLSLTQWAPAVMRYAKDRYVWAQYLPFREELGKKKGDTIRVPIYEWLSTYGSAIPAGTTVPMGSQDITSFTVTLDEIGRGLALEHTVDYYSNIANQQQLLMTLADNWANTWDYFCSLVFTSGQWYMSQVAAGSFTQGSGQGGGVGAGTLLGTKLLDGATIDRVYDVLRAAKTPKFPDGYYRWLSNAKTMRGLKEDVGRKNFEYYNNDGMGIKQQIIGVYGGFVFVETEENMTNGLSEAFGQNCGVQAAGMPMEIRYEPNYQTDFGRVQAWAYLAIMGTAEALIDTGTYGIRVYSHYVSV